SDYFSINTWGSKFGVPSLIVEHGYLSNSGDRALMDQDETLRKIAEAFIQNGCNNKPAVAKSSQPVLQYSCLLE
ncbi:MAG: hypothetical protein II197_05745, partial [Peptococcaceae bacterium]|nr:hypothetical protein [Peptococcaceae bacterium]